MGRSGSVCDLYGETLNEGHVAAAVAAACAAAGIEAGFTLLAPEHGDHYTLFLVADMPVAEDCRARLRELLEQELRENVHYDYCRRLGQLGAADLCLLPISAAAAHAVYLQTLLVRGRRAGDIKPVFLDADSDWRGRFSLSSH